jgi:hypothetical protein
MNDDVRIAPHYSTKSIVNHINGGLVFLLLLPPLYAWVMPDETSKLISLIVVAPVERILALLDSWSAAIYPIIFLALVSYIILFVCVRQSVFESPVSPLPLLPPRPGRGRRRD